MNSSVLLLFAMYNMMSEWQDMSLAMKMPHLACLALISLSAPIGFMDGGKVYGFQTLTSPL